MRAVRSAVASPGRTRGLIGALLVWAGALSCVSPPQEGGATEAVELASRLEWWALSEALAKSDAGVIEDCKTELALRRLRAHLAAAP